MSRSGSGCRPARRLLTSHVHGSGRAPRSGYTGVWSNRRGSARQRERGMTAAIEHFQARLERPADFGAFWQATIAELGQAPVNLTVEPDALRSTPRVSVAQVHFDSL